MVVCNATAVPPCPAPPNLQGHSGFLTRAFAPFAAHAVSVDLIATSQVCAQGFGSRLCVTYATKLPTTMSSESIDVVLLD